MRRQAATLVAAIALTSLGSGAASAQTDRKIYPATMCQQVGTTTPSIIRYNHGAAGNETSNTLRWICPLVRDDENTRTELRAILRDIFSTDSTCSLVTANDEGEWIAFDTHTVRGRPGVSQTTSFYVGTPYNSYGVDFLSCEVPGNSVLQSYRTYSYQ